MRRCREVANNRYARWPDTLQLYLRPIQPGQLHIVRRNTWNIVLVLDLSSPIGFEAASGQVLTLIQRNIPIHVGIVPMFDDVSDTCELGCSATLTFSGQSSQSYVVPA